MGPVMSYRRVDLAFISSDVYLWTDPSVFRITSPEYSQGNPVLPA